MAFDASPSWSGFNYQGKVALYHSLKIINSHLYDEERYDFELMLENTEDFEIVKAGESISLHQVKAYNNSNYSNYANALLEITLELYKNQTSKGYMHTWKKIPFKEGFDSLKNSIKGDINILLQSYNAEPKVGTSIIEIAATDEKNMPKNAAILRTAFNEHSADEIFTILNSIHDGADNSLDRLNAYIYDDGNDYCDLELINEKIKNEIRNLLINKEMLATDEQVKRTFHYFLGIIDAYITSRHKQKQQNDKITISSLEILEAITNDHEAIGAEYFSFHFKEMFARKIDEYMSDVDDYKIPTEGQTCNLCQASNYLLSLSPTELWVYYRSFSPHDYLKHNSNIDNAFEVNTEGIRYVLLKTLYLINHKNSFLDKGNSRLIYRRSALPEDNYLPTIISNTLPPEKIARQIIDNKGVNELHYEIGNVIYNGSVVYEFSMLANNNSVAPMEVGSDQRSKRNDILNLVKLIPILDAKDALL